MHTCIRRKNGLENKLGLAFVWSTRVVLFLFDFCILKTGDLQHKSIYFVT